MCHFGHCSPGGRWKGGLGGIIWRSAESTAVVDILLWSVIDRYSKAQLITFITAICQILGVPDNPLV